MGVDFFRDLFRSPPAPPQKAAHRSGLGLPRLHQ
jgi:hypothetical protein